MKKIRLYYSVKPYVPSAFRMAVRRAIASRKRNGCATWPISETAARRPEQWNGWPNGKKFALVLTHDVEGPEGLARCRDLMDLEIQLGFRSSFNFVPEGGYKVGESLRNHLTDSGFEVGVHDLRHDGKLYRSREEFSTNAKQINRYLKNWGASGFRSGFMLHDLDWLNELDISYDASTFDTDPFEPQPDGVNTIFPFWISNGNGGGYVELPYTLPQDSTLFLLLNEPDISIWKTKLEWIAHHGGMVLVDVHPDYLDFRGNRTRSEAYPVKHYRQLLEFARETYADEFWQPLPGELAEWYRAQYCSTNIARKESAGFSSSGAVASKARKDGDREPFRASRSTQSKRPGMGSPAPVCGKRHKIWIDFDNSPHVPFFLPIIEELKKRGYDLLLTSRDNAQVLGLLALHGLECKTYGRHYGRNKLRKIMGLGGRAAQLAPLVLRERPDLALSHGSRSQIGLSWLLNIPSLAIMDYEHVKLQMWGIRAKWLMIPEVLLDVLPYRDHKHILKYPGIKEDVYVPGFRAKDGIREELGMLADDVMVTIRPPANEAHYHNPESDELFQVAVDFLSRIGRVRLVILPRSTKQEFYIRQRWRELFLKHKIVIPNRVVDGLNLIWFSDLVISGGGTMNREAAALGVPVYSIFRGKPGAVDRYLSSNGRLTLLGNSKDVETIQTVRRERSSRDFNNCTLMTVVENVTATLESECHPQ